MRDKKWIFLLVGVMMIFGIMMMFIWMAKRGDRVDNDGLEENYREMKELQKKYLELLRITERLAGNSTIAVGGATNIQVDLVDDVSEERLWMAIVIPTVSRSGEENYLGRTMDSLKREIPFTDESFSGQIKVFVINHNKGEKVHARFDEIEGSRLIKKISGNKHVDSKVVHEQQTKDIIYSLNLMKKVNAKYVLLLEDDFEMCKNAFYAIEYVLRKSTKWNPNWIALRVSYGMNGIIIKKNDIDTFIAMFSTKLNVGKPPDHLFYDFCRSSGRDLMTYRNNLFFHIGKTSTFPNRQERYSPLCWQTSFDWLQDFERFRNEDCPHEDISPCKYGQTLEPLIDFDMKAGDICRHHFPLCWNDAKTLQDSREKSCRLRGG